MCCVGRVLWLPSGATLQPKKQKDLRTALPGGSVSLLLVRLVIGLVAHLVGEGVSEALEVGPAKVPGCL